MRHEVSVYFSDDMDREAIVYYNSDTDHYEIDFAENGKVVATESYIEHNLQYHEDAAENYVLGIKTLAS